MADPLQKLQLAIAGYLNSAPEKTVLAVYEHVPVIIYRPRKKEDGTVEDAVMIENTITNALAGLEPKNGKAGLAAIVMMPDAGIPAEMEKVKKGPFLQYEVTIRIIEDPLINMGEDGVRMTAEELAVITLQSLHGWYPGRTQVPLRGRARSALVPVTLKNPMQVAWDVNLTIRQQLEPLDATENPIITTDGALPGAVEVAISCEEDASIYYTTDGSFPSPRNAAAVLYTIPFIVTEAVTVSAVGYLANCLPSNIAETDIA